VGKITFLRQQYDSLAGQAVPITNQFTDTYISNGMVMHQQLERVINHPDFLFCAADNRRKQFQTAAGIAERHEQTGATTRL